MATDPAGAPGAPLRAPLRLILGLGNPGERYAETRHNLGFRVVEELARRRGLRLVDGACGSRMAEGPGLILAAPQTYMNRSGYAARCFAEHRGVAPQDLLVVYDDVALPLGRLRLRPSGSPGGHRGMESILENLGSARRSRSTCSRPSLRASSRPFSPWSCAPPTPSSAGSPTGRKWR